jgi:hypothetical protein
MSDVDAGNVKAKASIEYDGSGMKQFKEDLASLPGMVGGLGQSAGQAGEALSGLGEGMGGSAESARSFTSALSALPQIMEGGTSTISEMTGTLSEHRSAIAETGSAYGAIQSPIETTVSLLQDAAPQMQAISEHAQSMQAQLAPVHENFTQISESLSQAVPLLPQFADSMHSVSESFDPSAFGLDDFVKNTEVFQAALEDPMPFSMMKEHLLETGQTWDDFTSSLSESDAAMFSEMVQRTSGSYQVLDKAAGSAQKAGAAFTEAANGANDFTAQFLGMNDAAVEANKSIKETGGLLEETGKVSKGGGLFSGFLDSEVNFGGFFGGAMNLLNDIAMPLMAAQIIGQTVGAIGQSIYDSAAVAEGANAHMQGSFTGSVDTLKGNIDKTWQSFSEGFGQGVMPSIEASNNVTGQNGGLDLSGVGKLVGTNLGVLGDITQIVGGGLVGGLAKIVTLNPGNTFGNDWVQAGSEGLANTWAGLTGQPLPYPGPPVPQQNPFQGQIDQLNAMANNPQLLAAQAGYQSAYGKAVKAQEAYDVSHYAGTNGPTDDMNEILQYQAVRANGGTYGTLHGANADFFGWNDYLNGNEPAPLGCFPAGTPILLSNGTEKPIEDIQIDDMVFAHDGKQVVPAPVFALIRPPKKSVYKLVFSDGNTLTLTDSHPIASLQGWKSISPEATKRENPDLQVTPLQVGDSIHTIDGEATLTSITPMPGKVPVFNITVGEPHTFYAGGVLVHNKTLGHSIGSMSNEGVGSEQVQVSHTFVANVQWEANNLTKQFTGAASWVGQNLANTFQGAASWVAQGLSNTFQGATTWVAQGLSNIFQGVTSWVAQGLSNTFNGVASWVGQGLSNTFNGVASWAAEGLSNTFKGIASWVGSGLEHTFNAVANWTAQNLSPNFTVNPSFTMLAEGTSDWPGGPAIVGEAGPEVVEHNGQYSMFDAGASLVNLPPGANVYPMKNLQGSSVAQFANGTGENVIPLNIGLKNQGGNMPESINVYLNIDGQTFWSATGMSLAQSVYAGSGNRSY